MTNFDSTIAKLQQLPEPLLQEVSDFIDFVLYKHQAETEANNLSDEARIGAWLQWFEGVECLDVAAPPESASSYPQLLLDKYRQQGLDL